jgi:hypothetical protein
VGSIPGRGAAPPGEETTGVVLWRFEEGAGFPEEDMSVQAVVAVDHPERIVWAVRSARTGVGHFLGDDRSGVAEGVSSRLSAAQAVLRNRQDGENRGVETNSVDLWGQTVDPVDGLGCAAGPILGQYLGQYEPSIILVLLRASDRPVPQLEYFCEITDGVGDEQAGLGNPLREHRAVAVGGWKPVPFVGGVQRHDLAVVGGRLLPLLRGSDPLRGSLSVYATFAIRPPDQT